MTAVAIASAPVEAPLRSTWRAFLVAASRWRRQDVTFEEALAWGEAMRREAGEPVVSMRMLEEATSAILAGIDARQRDAELEIPDIRHAAAMRAAALAAGGLAEGPDPGRSTLPAMAATIERYARVSAAWRGEPRSRREAIAWANTLRRRRREPLLTNQLLADCIDAIHTGFEANRTVALSRGARRSRTDALLTADRAAGPPRPLTPLDDVSTPPPAAIPTRQRWREYGAAASAWRGARASDRDPISWADTWRRSLRRPRLTDQLLSLAVERIAQGEAALIETSHGGPLSVMPRRLADLAAGLPVPDADTLLQGPSIDSPHQASPDAESASDATPDASRNLMS